MYALLQAAWEGPYHVVDRASKVTYKVSKGDDHSVRLAHRDNLKLYVDRPLSVNAVTLVAEEQGISPELLTSKVNLSSDRCPGFRQCELDSVLGEVKQHFSTCPRVAESWCYDDLVLPGI